MVVICGKMWGNIILLKKNIIFQVITPLEIHAKVGKLKSEIVSAYCLEVTDEQINNFLILAWWKKGV